ncbi:WecB/TagA/CpsF family glycosyltransferase [Paludicola sp. MB14-C6]|uniref:WecB/TagA/CpsF family glycosyltransferase n=1 Tax=Paludihabitans sp. MB14-C6 TaxID=3070656 RepID=UPI0027DBC07A|nr:WecB/TagA/CpsF family glycosyltransferase [Paludicola sp. MB14-C6]WMJ22634.1 WecB/TagA/CpsF family glycosyltransferase [Paludicola sp. MB14-C6]
MKKYLEKVFGKTQKEFFELVESNIKRDKKMFIITANPETLMIGVNSPDFNQVLLEDDVTITPDGIGVVKALSMLNMDVEERITGVDIARHLLDVGNQNQKSIYLYGAKPEVLDAFVAKIKNEYADLVVLGAKDGYHNVDDDVFLDIVEKKPDIVLIALGIPRQELLIHKYYNQMEKGIFVGVGGTFDVLSGTKKRAPKFFIKMNLEWLYRIAKEPKRFNRFYKSNIQFMKLVNRLKREG